MMSLGQIQDMQMTAAARAAAEKRIPFQYWPNEPIETPFPFPDLGDYVPEGWRKIDDLFCDSSGWGSPGEAAMTADQLLARIHEENEKHGYRNGWAITEQGQFQVYVGLYVKEDR